MPGVLRQFSNIVNPGIRQVPIGPLRVDWSHPLTRGLVGAWIPGAMGNVDITGHVVRPLTVDSGAGLLNGISREGPGQSDGNTTQRGMSGAATPEYKSWSGFTLYFRGRALGNSAGDANFTAITYTNTLSSPFTVASIGAGTGGTTSQISLSWNVGGTLTQLQNQNFGFTANSVDGFAATFLPSNNVANTVILYRNGIAVANTKWSTTSAAGPTSATSQICINREQTGASRAVNMVCLASYYWNRVLDAAEIAELDRGPYGLFAPEEYEMPISFFPTTSAFKTYWAPSRPAIGTGLL